MPSLENRDRPIAPQRSASAYRSEFQPRGRSYTDASMGARPGELIDI
jgi:hypothetical protein